VTICSLDAPANVESLTRTLLPALADAASPSLATFVEEPSENTFPALPVRTGEHVVVWVQRVLDRLARAGRPRARTRRAAPATSPLADGEITPALNGLSHRR
jgi:hypothetical protein